MIISKKIKQQLTFDPMKGLKMANSMLKIYELLMMRTDLSRTDMHCCNQSRTIAANEGVKCTIWLRLKPKKPKKVKETVDE